MIAKTDGMDKERPSNRELKVSPGRGEETERMDKERALNREIEMVVTLV